MGHVKINEKIVCGDNITITGLNESNTIRNDFQHKTLEQRYKEYGGEIGSLEEHDFGEPVGREIW